MNKPVAILALAAAAALAAPADAGILYKSVGPNGTIMFSDVPPGGDARILEQRPLSPGSSSTPAPSANGGDLVQLIDSDAALSRANMQFDLAERALAVARRDMWAQGDGLKLVSRRASRSDEERIEFYKRNVVAARQALMEILRERMLASR